MSAARKPASSKKAAKPAATDWIATLQYLAATKTIGGMANMVVARLSKYGCEPLEYHWVIAVLVEALAGATREIDGNCSFEEALDLTLQRIHDRVLLLIEEGPEQGLLNRSRHDAELNDVPKPLKRRSES